LRHRGEITVDLELGSMIITHSFLVVDSWELPGQMLIDTDFTDAHHVVYSSQSPFLVINGQEVEVVLSCSSSSSLCAATRGCGGRPATTRGTETPGTPVWSGACCTEEHVQCCIGLGQVLGWLCWREWLRYARVKTVHGGFVFHTQTGKIVRWSWRK